MQYFYVIEIAHPEIRCLLNAMCVMADPRGTEGAHVTLRGPHKRRVKTQKFRQLLFNQKISILGVGQFFGKHQSTVFLHCGFPLLEEVWFKPDYRDRNCHITVYDGDDKGFAKELFSVLRSRKLYFSFYPSSIIEVPDIPRQMDMSGQWKLDLSCLDSLLGISEAEWLNAREEPKPARIMRISAIADVLQNRMFDSHLSDGFDLSDGS